MNNSIILLYFAFAALCFFEKSTAFSLSKYVSCSTNRHILFAHSRSFQHQSFGLNSMNMINDFGQSGLLISSKYLNIIPLCITATSKTTVINDPTAGMNSEEISNYVSIVGGGLCGIPEAAKSAVGFGLTLNLIAFALFTISYVILGGLNFALEKEVEDFVKPYDFMGDKTSDKAVKGKGDLQRSQNIEQQMDMESKADGLNRSQRRLKQKIETPTDGSEKN